MRRALADRRLELGTVKALAAELGLSESATSRLLKNGPPRSWSEAQLERFAETLYARAHVASEARTPSERDLIAAKRKEPVYSMEGRVAALTQLGRALIEFESRRACMRGSWTPRAALARELGVTSVRLGRWIRAGNVPSDSMGRVSEWAMQRVEAELRRIALQSKIGDLIQESKKPALAAALTGAKAKQAARAPDMKTGESRVDSMDQSGYQWQLRIEEWSSFPLIERMVKWAASRKRPKGMTEQASRWIVTAFTSIYDPSLDIVKSPGGFRQFEHKDNNELGRKLMLGALVSSRMISRGGLERAVELFRENMVAHHCANDLMFVHAVIVRNWRLRSDSERRARRQRENAKYFNELRLAEIAKERASKKTRASAKKKALGRNRSRAGGVRPRGKKKPT